MSIQENEVIARRFEEGYNTGNTADAAEFIDPGFVMHGPAASRLPLGPEGYREAVRTSRAGFPDLHMSIEDMVVAEDKVAIRYQLRGTHANEFEGIPPTGKQAQVSGVVILHIAHGKITEGWEVYDTLAFQQQLGLVQPSPVVQAAG